MNHSGPPEGGLLRPPISLCCVELLQQVCEAFHEKKFPTFSSQIFNIQGQVYNVTAIVNDKFEIDMQRMNSKDIYLSVFFAITYGLGFDAVIATLTHGAIFNGREIYDQFQASYKGKIDVHTKLMRRYEDIPNWWFRILLAGLMILSLVLCIFMKNQVQMPWWSLLFAAALASTFSLPISIITATTNQFVGTVIAGTINISVAWWLLNTIQNICHDQFLPPNSPLTCPGDRVFFDASVIWGLVGPRRIFDPLGNYPARNWFFLGGALGPILVWLLHKKFPSQKWIKLINLPKWWQRYNYVLSAALDAGLAFMGVRLYFCLQLWKA